MAKNNDLWVKICLLPLIIGFSLVYANLSMVIFRIIGWILLVIGSITGAFYLFDLYITHREKIWKFLRKLHLVK